VPLAWSLGGKTVGSSVTQHAGKLKTAIKAAPFAERDSDDRLECAMRER
jgi:hypothetical protein